MFPEAGGAGGVSARRGEGRNEAEALEKSKFGSYIKRRSCDGGKSETDYFFLCI